VDRAWRHARRAVAASPEQARELRRGAGAGAHVRGQEVRVARVRELSACELCRVSMTPVIKSDVFISPK